MTYIAGYNRRMTDNQMTAIVLAFQNRWVVPFLLALSLM
jgi:hypothetical protein